MSLNPQRRRACGLAGAVGGSGGALRRRQVHAAACCRPARISGRRRGLIDRLATSTLSDGQRTRLRRTEIGFVYQFHHLLPEFSAHRECDAAADDPRPVAEGSASARDGTAELSGTEGSPDAPAGGIVGRRAAARRARPRGRQRARASCSPTSRPAISTRIRLSACSGR